MVEETNHRRDKTNPRRDKKKNPDEIRQTRDEIRQTPDAKIKSTGGAHSGETAVTQSMPRDGRKIPVYISDITLRQLAEAYRRA